MEKHKKAIMMPRHKLSGGFKLLFTGLLGPILGLDDRYAGLPASEGEVREIQGKPWCWVTIHDGGITVPVETLAKYSVCPGNFLLPVRESLVTLAFLVKGPLVKEAKKYELPVYE